MTPKIYVACLASYNAGTLHGAWIDATQDVEDIQEEIQAMLKASPVPNAEEYAVHDYSHFGPLAIRLGEYPSLETVSQIGQAIAEAAGLGALAAFMAWVNNVVVDQPEDITTDAFWEAFLGTYDSVEAYAAQFLEDTGELQEIPAHLRSYFDHKAYARDMVLGGDIVEVRQGGHSFIFSGNC